MPLYDYKCRGCGWAGELCVPIDERDFQFCPDSLPGVFRTLLDRQMAAPMGRIAGRIPQGGGPDRFTADVLGIPLKELPAGLKSS